MSREHERVLNFVGGAFVEPKGGEWLDNVAPATGQKICDIPNSREEDVQAAVEAARKCLPEWGKLSVEDRAQWLDRIADELERCKEEVASLESLDTGKPMKIALAIDASRSIANFRFFANHVRQPGVLKEEYAMDDAHNHVVFKPVGVAALITPWNLPLYLLSWKIAPALVMGNAVVCKPSEFTPLTANFLARVVQRIGLPAGVINIVHGQGQFSGHALVNHPDVNAVSFTGGTVTGRRVAAAASSSFKKLSLELGGKNATIVFADCDLDKAVAGAARAAFANQGQVCLCGSRLLIERSLFDTFKSRLVAHVRALRIGDPANPDTDFGALISAQHREKVLSYIALAKEEGGTILTGGDAGALVAGLDPALQGGYWVPPTIVEGLGIGSRCATEEIFGPVVTLHPFDTEEQAVAMANGVRYGLAGSVWTANLDKGRRVAAAMESGMVWVNCWLHRDLRVPFGGVKESGVGREGGSRSLEFFSEPQNVCVMGA